MAEVISDVPAGRSPIARPGWMCEEVLSPPRAREQPAGTGAGLAHARLGRRGRPAQRWWPTFASALAKDPVLRPQEGSAHENGTISKSRSLASPTSAV